MQEEIFLAREADAWFERNRDSLLVKTPDGDPVCRALDAAGLAPPRRVLEIGCANGYRLAWLREKHGCACFGLEPSAKAIDDGSSRYPDIALHRGTATDMGALDGQFDLIIFGFCLYLAGRQSLFQIAFEADRKLETGGHIAIFDFQTEAPLRNAYAHREGVFSYKMDYARMFDWNPQYSRIYSVVEDHEGGPFGGDENEAVGTSLLLKSDPEQAYRRGG